MNRPLFLLFGLALAAPQAFSQPAPAMPSTAATPAIPKQPWHPAFNEKVEKEYGYASAVRIGDTLYVSGVPGVGDMPKALNGVYKGLTRVLAAHGLDFRHVVKETLYATDLDAVAANNKVRLGFYDGETPAATWVQVQRLLMPQAVLEVEVIAVFPKEMSAPAAR